MVSNPGKFLIQIIFILISVNEIINSPIAERLSVKGIKDPKLKNEKKKLLKARLANNCQAGSPEPIWEDDEITETYCRCPSGTYGLTCLEDFVNPCNGVQTYHRADAQIKPNYFIECNGKIPYLMKCARGTKWNQDILTCDWNWSGPGSYGEATGNPVVIASPQKKHHLGYRGNEEYVQKSVSKPIIQTNVAQPKPVPVKQQSGYAVQNSGFDGQLNQESSAYGVNSGLQQGKVSLVKQPVADQSSGYGSSMNQNAYQAQAQLKPVVVPQQQQQQAFVSPSPSSAYDASAVQDSSYGAQQSQQSGYNVYKAPSQPARVNQQLDYNSQSNYEESTNYGTQQVEQSNYGGVVSQQNANLNNPVVNQQALYDQSYGNVAAQQYSPPAQQSQQYASSSNKQQSSYGNLVSQNTGAYNSEQSNYGYQENSVNSQGLVAPKQPVSSYGSNVQQSGYEQVLPNTSVFKPQVIQPKPNIPHTQVSQSEYQVEKTGYGSGVQQQASYSVPVQQQTVKQIVHVVPAYGSTQQESSQVDQVGSYGNQVSQNTYQPSNVVDQQGSGYETNYGSSQSGYESSSQQQNYALNEGQLVGQHGGAYGSSHQSFSPIYNQNQQTVQDQDHNSQQLYSQYQEETQTQESYNQEQQQPAYAAPAPVQQQQAYVAPAPAPAQQQPAYVAPAPAPAQQQPAYVAPAPAPAQQQQQPTYSASVYNSQQQDTQSYQEESQPNESYNQEQQPVVTKDLLKQALGNLNPQGNGYENPIQDIYNALVKKQGGSSQDVLNQQSVQKEQDNTIQQIQGIIAQGEQKSKADQSGYQVPKIPEQPAPQPDYIPPPIQPSGYQVPQIPDEPLPQAGYAPPVQVQQPVYEVQQAPVVQPPVYGNVEQPVVRQQKSLLNFLIPKVTTAQYAGNQQFFKIDIPFDKSGEQGCPDGPNGVVLGLSLSVY
ncbi:unnamed protein product [Brachionus calyciflorus]|uniref:Chitin-binding type-2 domain-containing protein n=1 Tax=Brachionus calyciflorus TaxID=104777 RepID=A0A813YIL8_9BILA|nr:unnamed protein product [Brachionus calyciflorus]